MSEDNLETVETLRRELAAEKKKAAEAQAKLDRLSDFVSLEQGRSSHLRRGGNGRGSMIRKQSIRSDLGRLIAMLFTYKVLTHATAIFPNGWRIYSDNSTSVCQNILRLMGYGGTNPDRELPDFCKGSFMTFWQSIFGILNTTRQSYANALQKRLMKKMASMLKDENTISNSVEDDYVPQSPPTLEEMKENLEQLVARYEDGGVEVVIGTEPWDYFVQFLVIYGPKCVPHRVSEQVAKKLDTGNLNHFLIEEIGQGALCLGLLHFLNNVDRIIDGESLGRDNMGGRWSKGSGKGGNVGTVGDIALDEEGIKMHSSFFRFMYQLVRREDYNELNEEILEKWMDKKDDATLARANKKRKKSKCAEETEAPDFGCLLGDDLALG